MAEWIEVLFGMETLGNKHNLCTKKISAPLKITQTRATVNCQRKAAKLLIKN